MKIKTAIKRMKIFAQQESDIALGRNKFALMKSQTNSRDYVQGHVDAYGEVIKLCDHLLQVHKQQKKERNKP